MRYRRRATLGVLMTMSIGACSDESTPANGNSTTSGTVAAPAASTGGPLTPDAGRKIITVEMETDAQGNNIFKPSTIEANRGDIIRYTLVAGVHNAHYLPDSNPGKSRLPGAGPLLQLPGQTYDVKVTLDPGEYYFHCDPHALLGMKGHLKVVP